MTWPKTGATHYHAQLKLPDKGRAVKWLDLETSDQLKRPNSMLLSTVP